MKINPEEDVLILHELTMQTLKDWFNDYPADARKIQAFNCLQEANQYLYAACINLDAILKK